MSAEPKEITPAEIWTQWEGKLVNGTLPLRRFLGCSNHAGVFLTEQSAENRPQVAIKFVPADISAAEGLLVRWGAATTLIHPNLVRIFDVGRYRCEGRDYLYAVMEHADQTLAEILPRRPLAVEEVRELLVPTLDTLLFLHRKGLIHGRLKPSNFLAVNDRLKLASDSIRPIEHSASGRTRTSAYDPPESKDRGLNAAGDMWGLGMTLLEALTQQTTAWPDETVFFPADLPAPFDNTVLRCLSIAPAGRPTVLDLEAQFKFAQPAAPTPTRAAAAQPSVSQAPPPKPAPPAPAPARSSAPTAAATVAPKKGSWRRGLAIFLPFALAAWLIVHFFGNKSTPPQPPAAPTPAPVATPTAAKPAEPAPTTSAPAPTTAAPAAVTSQPATSPDVVHQVIPVIPPDAQNKIRGRIHVTVRVLVDKDGNVMGAMVENPGPSQFLADLAEQAAGDWKFAPAAKQKTRVWMVLFVFTRNGVNARATAQ